MAVRAILKILFCCIISSLFVLTAPSEPSEVSWSLNWSSGMFNNTATSGNPGGLSLDKGIQLLWEARYDRSDHEVATAVAVDSQDNIVVTGYCRLSCDFYRTVKYDPQGHALWTRRYGTGTRERASGVAIDSQDNAIVVGYSVSGGYIYHVIKYDPNGEELWSRIYNGGEFGRAFDVAVDSGDNIVVVGLVNSDAYILKYSSDGRLLWTKRLDCGGTEETAAVSVDSEGNIIVAGASMCSRRSGDGQDYYIIKLDSQGNLLWDRNYDGGGSDAARGVAVDSQNRIIATGYSERNGHYDYYTIKLDPEGNQIWGRRLDGAGEEIGWAAAVDRAANIIITGTTARDGDKNCYTAKYDSQGQLLWDVYYDRCNCDMAYAVVTDSQGSIIVAGTSLGDYQLLKYSDGYLPQGSYTSAVHYFGDWVRFTTLRADAALHGGKLLARVETSDDRFATVKRVSRFPLQTGQLTYDISHLGRARYAQVRLYFRTEDPRVSPALYSLAINASAD